MKTLYIAICDDEANILKTISRITKNTFSEFNAETEIECFAETNSLKDRMKNMRFDIIMLDIDMPGKDGINFGRELREGSDCPDIIYVSNREDKVFESFSVHPFGFIRKSKFLKDIVDVVELYMKLYAAKDLDKEIIVQTHNSKIKIKVNEIMYIEGNRCYQRLFIKNMKDALDFRSTMEKLEEDFKNHGFSRIHKGYIINLRYLRRIDTDTITLINGVVLPVSRRKTAILKTEFMDFGRENGIKMI